MMPVRAAIAPRATVFDRPLPFRTMRLGSCLAGLRVSVGVAIPVGLGGLGWRPHDALAVALLALLVGVVPVGLIVLFRRWAAWATQQRG